MHIVCPICNAEYRVARDRIPAKPIQASCKKCGGKFLVEPQEGQNTVFDARIVVETGPATPSATEAKHPISAKEDRSGPDLALISEYPELQDLASGKIALEEIFTPNRKGSYRTRANRFKLKILRAIHGSVDRMLQADEKVRRIGKATAYYPAEIIFGSGYFTMMYNCYAVAATDKRLLFINVNPRMSKPTHYYFQAPYDGIRKVATGLFGRRLVLYKKKGKRRVFTGMKRSLAKGFQQFIRERQRFVRPAKPAEQMVEDLCPSCFMPLTKDLLTCPECTVAFKKPMTAFFRSLLLPGLGDIYLGHRLLGFIELLGSLVVWTVVIFAFLQGDQADLVVALAVLVFYNLVDALLTRHMARKGYMLAVK